MRGCFSISISLALFLFSSVFAGPIPKFNAGERIKAGELRSKFRFSIGDFNGDGKKDIILLSAGGDRGFVHHNEGTDASPKFGFADRIIVNLSETAPDYMSYSNCLQAMDWDGDGDLDLVVADQTCQPMLVKNTGTPAVHNLSQGNYMGKAGVQTAFGADWDKDGKNDLIVFDTRLWWQKNASANTLAPSLGTARGFRRAGGATVVEAHPFAVDWNNDNLMDIVACGVIMPDYGSHPYAVGAPTVRLYLGTSTLDSLSEPATIPNVAGGSSLSVVDWNNDNKKDLLVMDSAQAILRLYLNTGTDAAPSFSANPDTVSGTDFNEMDEAMQTQWADWNKDSRTDLVIAGNFNSHCSGMQPLTKLYLNVSADNEPAFKYGRYLTEGGSPVKWEWNAQAGSQAVICDINHDNNWDMYMTVWRYSSGNPCDLFLYTGDATTRSTLDFASHVACAFGVGGTAFLNPAMGLLNNDALEDLVLSQPLAYPYPSRISFFPNNGTASSPSFSDATRQTLMDMDYNLDGASANPFVCDLDGNGLQDLVMGSGVMAWGGDNPHGVRFYANSGTTSAPAFSRASFAACSLKTGGPVALPAPAFGPVRSNDARQEARAAPAVADYDNDGLKDLIVAYGVDHGAFNVWSAELWLFRQGTGSTINRGRPLPVSSNLALSASPNPFRSAVDIRLSGRPASLKIFDASGRLVRDFPGRRAAWRWDAPGLGSGIYVAKASDGDKEVAVKLFLQR